MSARRILLVDVDAFFVAVARLVDPDGAGKEPLLIVGGSAEGRGVVCSASYETRKFGVRSAMPMARALALCPGAVRVPVPGKACAAKSREIRAILTRLSPIVESASVDEWYCDLAGTEALYHHEPLATTAHRIRDVVHQESGLTVSIGGATSKLLAKIAAEKAKPKPGSGATGVFVVPDGGEAEFLRGLALAEFPLIGPKFQERLARVGLRTVADVLAVDSATLTGWLGVRAAAWLQNRIHGLDDRHVYHRDLARSISRDETFARDLSSDAELERELLRLVARAASDLRHDGLATRTITVKIRDFDFRRRSAAFTLPGPVISDRVVYATARQLLAKLRKARRVPARLVGVTLAKLCDPQSLAPEQLALFDAMNGAAAHGETERDRVVARTVDRLRERFGKQAVLPGGIRDTYRQ